ncbi:MULTISPECIES: helix-turn-helix domain-containing protein [Arthrobacter]|uniref:Helix-turn-helix domain-containing protein n=2 Tax=Arthrobacter TaxID=1663 RepID=A0ABU9KLL0_9MICC|nr:helix-turn-helix domain-containing protein [Arthrobacter sp. YJM1]MDP5227738.1 helix-turn-helix domain-containing protein [Arthrobacter sp. YJM1]
MKLGVGNTLAAGAVLVVPGRAPEEVERHFGEIEPLERWTSTCIRVSAEAISGMAPPHFYGFGIFEQTSSLDRAIRDFAVRIFHERSSHEGIPGYATEQLLTEMACSVILDKFGSASLESPADALRNKALAIISQRCADAELSPLEVAFAVRTSLRRLQAIFSEEGTTIALEIRKQRSRLALSLLQDGRFDVLSMQEVAEKSGFKTLVSMRRAFLEFHGTKPRDFRSHRAS